MSTEEFTPGEWKASEFLYNNGESTNFYISSGLKEVSVCLPTGRVSKEEAKANAALIAAAPEMYKRLKSVKSDLWALSVNPAINEQTKECIDIIIKNIEDDLKKARGEE